jgi:CRP-like cAMP-binding protein
VAYWEHGATVADCRREYERKLALADGRRTATARSDHEQKLAACIARRCPGLIVTLADGQTAGFCAAGTAGFLARHDLAGRATVTAAELRRTGDVQVERVITVAALRVARERLTKGA